MEYFVYCRDRPGSDELRLQLIEAHWSFMDAYADRMIARGPTLADDEDTATGSLHIVDLPDADAAREFAFDEPNYRAGVYSEVMIRRWRNLLGRTMWEFPGGSEGGDRFLVLGHGRGDERPDPWVEAFGDRLIVCGELLADDGSTWMGDTAAVELPTRSDVAAAIGARAAAYERLEIHRWRFGGRPT
jgi:uncharacterized protein